MERELRLAGLRVLSRSDWLNRFPDLAQGITVRDPEYEFSVSAQPAPGGDRRRNGWKLIREAAEVPRLARCQQVHGASVVVVGDEEQAGERLFGKADALVTNRAGVVLAITVADCVPVFMLSSEHRVLGLAHAGWRGIAAGVVEATARRVTELGANLGTLQVHLGPAICGACYEVGPEVPAALGGVPPDTRRVDLRARIARRLLALGVPAERVTASEGCTRCDRERFFSYRGGDRGRRMCAFLGWASR